MDKYFRYFDLLKKANYGLHLRHGAVLNYLKLHLGGLKSKIGGGDIHPVLVFINAVRRCNLNCHFCISGKFPSTNWEDYELTIEKFKNILKLDIVKKALVFCFTGGGEPLLNADLTEIIKICRKNKYIAGVISNGLLLSEQKAMELNKAGLCDMQVSIYDNTKDKLAIILPKASHLLSIHSSYVLVKTKLYASQKDNFNELIDIIKMSRESGCKSFKINICEPDVFTNDNSETIGKDDVCVYHEFISIAKKQLVDIEFRGYSCNKIMPTNKFTVFLPSPIISDNNNRLCRLPWSLLPLDANGNTVICCKFYPLFNKIDEGEVYNMFHDGEEYCINSKKAIDIRTSMLNKNIPLESECINCCHNNKSYISQI
jgi:organic radical activating enzyme